MPRPTDVATAVARAESTGAATDVSIIAAVASTTMHIKRIVITSSVLTTITLNSTSAAPANTEILKLLDSKGIVLEGFEFLKTVNGEALTYTTGAGNSEVYCEYAKL